MIGSNNDYVYLSSFIHSHRQTRMLILFSSSEKHLCSQCNWAVLFTCCWTWLVYKERFCQWCEV